MRGSALKLILVIFGALVALWLVGALVQGLLVSLSLTSARFFLFWWWFQKFGLGVVVGFVLGLLAAWLVSDRRSDEPQRRVEERRPNHLEEARRELRALQEELRAEREREP